MKRLKFLLLLMLVAPMLVNAQSSANNVLDRHIKGFFVNKNANWIGEGRNELTISLGVGAMDVDRQYYGCYDYEPYYYSGPCYKESYLYNSLQYPSISLGYTYRLMRNLAIEITAGYSAKSDRYYDFYTDKYLLSSNISAFTVMPNLKLYWLNRKYVSVYSSFGLGLGFISTTNDEGQRGYNDFSTELHYHAALIGIQAGKKIFGFAELGNSAYGTFRCGLGYRF